MIIVYDAETGDLVRAIEGELVNLDTYRDDGYGQGSRWKISAT